MKRLKPTWDDVQKILPDVNYGESNFIRGGKKIPLQVTLFQDGEKKMDATVHMFGSARQLYGAALYMVERRMKENDISVVWNEVQFLGSSAIMPRFDPMKGDELVQDMDRSLVLPFADTVGMIRDVFKKPSLPEQIIPSSIITRAREALYQDHICAAVRAHTAVVISDDMERMIFEKKWHLPFSKFTPRGMEF